MEQWIITIGGIKYLLKSDVPLTQEQIEYTISQLSVKTSSVKTLSKTCITSATIGQTLSLQNTIQSGTAPYNVSIKKDGSILQSWTATSLLTQTVNYTLVPADVGTRRFSVDTSDSCSTGAKSTTEYCDVVVSAAAGTLSFSSSPSGAEIYIDDVDQEKTTGASPVNISVSAGTHTWKLTLSGYNNATGSQLVVAGQTYTINPTLVQIATVCTWISAKGGWTVISAYNIMELVSGYSGATSLGFTVTAAHIMGAVAYYSDNLSSGNNLTGCGFT